jgi:transposase InsO family protein
MDPVVPTKESEGAITVTPAEIIYHRRLAVLDHATRCGNVSEACRTFGVSRTRYYEWKKLAERYGPEALLPKARRRPELPNATPTHVVEQLLSLAVLEPTVGARRLADRLADAGWPLAASTAQKYLHQAGLGTRRQRVARAALVAAAAGGLVTEAAREAQPMGFCHVAPGPAELVSLDSFYIGNLKGVGRVYQLTAVDVFSRWATVAIMVGTPTGVVTTRFVADLVRHWRRHGYAVRAVITDNGPEYVAAEFRQALAARGIRHVRIPPRSPNHNAVVERFQGTMLQECWRPAFHRRRFISRRQLQAAADAWLITYNHRRRNHSDYMRGRTPHQILTNHPTQLAS